VRPVPGRSSTSDNQAVEIRVVVGKEGGSRWAFIQARRPRTDRRLEVVSL
jgi:hypothetical protein